MRLCVTSKEQRYHVTPTGAGVGGNKWSEAEVMVPVQATTDKTIYLVGLRSCAIMASDMSMMRYR